MENPITQHTLLYNNAMIWLKLFNFAHRRRDMSEIFLSNNPSLISGLYCILYAPYILTI